MCVCARAKYRPHMHKNGGAAPEIERAAHDPPHLQHLQLCGRVECVTKMREKRSECNYTVHGHEAGRPCTHVRVHAVLDTVQLVRLLAALVEAH